MATDGIRTLELIVEAIHGQENHGARRAQLFILCGACAAQVIGDGLEADGRLVRRTTHPVQAPSYPHIEQHIPRDTLVKAWRGEILGVPVLFDPDCPTNAWRVERVPDADKQKRIAQLNADLAAGKLMLPSTDEWRRMMDDACRDAVKVLEAEPRDYMPRRKGYRFEDERQTRDLVACLERRGQEQRLNPDALRLGYPLKHLTLTADEDARARAEWSRRLREKQTEARRKEREQVVVDLDWD